jgi:oligopeptide/dipeptide ABC transporter ATP-binding protein
MSGHLIRIRGLDVSFETRAGLVRALRGIDLDIPRGKILGVVGESGSGKSTLAAALMRLLPRGSARVAGSIEWDVVNLLALSEDEIRRWRGRRMAMIFQDPMTALNPVFTVGTQLIDALTATRGTATRPEKRERARAMLERVGIADATRRLDAYPHELSGGMRQRVMIAMALLAEPELLIADEPTTALDVTVEAQIMDLFETLRREFSGTILFISHSLGLVSRLCDEVVVMYAGTIVETAKTRDVFGAPAHPYTRALVDCEIAGDVDDDAPLAAIAGQVPSLIDIPPGCAFAPRCALREDRCMIAAPTLRAADVSRRVACVRA